MIPFKYSPKDFIWEVTRRNKDFRDGYESLGVDDDGSKQADPGFCWNWCVKKLYSPNTSIDDIKRNFSNNVIDDADHPVLYRFIYEKSKLWLENHIQSKEDSNKEVASDEAVKKFLEFNDNRVGWLYEKNEKFQSLIGKQLNLFDMLTVQGSPEDFEYEETSLDPYVATEYVVNVKDISTCFRYFKIYDKVEELIILKYPTRYVDGAISLPERFSFLEIYDEEFKKCEKEKRINKIKDSVFENKNYLRRMLEKHQIKAFESDRSGKKMGIKELKDSIASAQTDEALEKKAKRAFTTISNLIVNTPHNIVFSPAKIEPTK